MKSSVMAMPSASSRAVRTAREDADGMAMTDDFTLRDPSVRKLDVDEIDVDDPPRILAFARKRLFKELVHDQLSFSFLYKHYNVPSPGKACRMASAKTARSFPQKDASASSVVGEPFTTKTLPPAWSVRRGRPAAG